MQENLNTFTSPEKRENTTDLIQRSHRFLLMRHDKSSMPEFLHQTQAYTIINTVEIPDEMAFEEIQEYNAIVILIKQDHTKQIPNKCSCA